MHNDDKDEGPIDIGPETSEKPEKPSTVSSESSKGENIKVSVGSKKPAAKPVKSDASETSADDLSIVDDLAIDTTDTDEPTAAEAPAAKPADSKPASGVPPVTGATAPPVVSSAATPLLLRGKSSRRRKLKWLLGLVILIALIVAGGLWWHSHHVHEPKVPVVKKSSKQVKSQGLQLDPNKDYGNKYKDGILPVGDGKYSSDSAKVGSVYTCSKYAQNLSSDQGGAGTRGPWFTNNNTEYDVNKKAHVQGSVMWQASFSNTISGTTRNIVTNDLPTHPTGVFPIAASDPAYAFDRNPNSIKGQTLTYALNADPTYGVPNCMGGEAGIMLTGVALFNAFDAGGRDAGAWEVQDSCSGHPQKEGVYHYHTLSSCIKDVSVHTVIGYALDGFPITGPQVSANNILTSSDLDACHGIGSEITLDGKPKTMYHYVLTQDFPYSVSCFRGQAIQPPDTKTAQPAGAGARP